MTEAAFHGSVSFEEGSEIKTVVSFPGQYQEDWQCLVRRSVKRSAFEKDATEDPGQPCRHYVSGSTACVFLPQGSKFFGGHVPNEDGTSDVCWCQDWRNFSEVRRRHPKIAELTTRPEKSTC